MSDSYELHISNTLQNVQLLLWKRAVSPCTSWIMEQAQAVARWIAPHVFIRCNSNTGNAFLNCHNSLDSENNCKWVILHLRPNNILVVYRILKYEMKSLMLLVDPWNENYFKMPMSVDLDMFLVYLVDLLSGRLYLCWISLNALLLSGLHVVGVHCRRCPASLLDAYLVLECVRV